jgi:hypothetical protein
MPVENSRVTAGRPQPVRPGEASVDPRPPGPRGHRPGPSRVRRDGLSSPAPAKERGAGAALELVSETVDEEVNLGALYDTLAALLARAYRRGALTGNLVG